MDGPCRRLGRDHPYQDLWECARSVMSTLLENGLYDSAVEKETKSWYGDASLVVAWRCCFKP